MFFFNFFGYTNTHRRTQRHLTQRHSVGTLSYFKLIEDNDMKRQRVDTIVMITCLGVAIICSVV